MKRIINISALLCCTITASFAQKQDEPLPYNKEHLDSLFRSFPKLDQPFVMPGPKKFASPGNFLTESPNSFESANPGATIINQTNKGTVYNMPLDNMAVLVPDMNAVEKMWGGSLYYKPAPQSNMPNPLMPQRRRSKK